MEKSLLIPKVLLTICAMEFFGPIVRDSGHSHLINVEWVGHARVHLAWLLGFMGLSGVVNLWFIWRDSESKVRDLQLSALWQGCNLFGFWIAVAFVGAYEGAIIDPKHHHLIFGIDENIFAFSILTSLWAAAALSLKKHGGAGLAI